MVTAETVTLTELAGYLRVSSSTLVAWDTSGYLMSFGGQYLIAAVNERLAEGARGFATPPTLEDIIAGRLVLLTPDEAAAIMGVSTRGIHDALLCGRIRAIKYAQDLRYDKASVEEYLATRVSPSDDEFPPWKSLRHICGLSWNIVQRMVDEGRLVDASQGTPNPNRVTRESLLAYLREQLPSWISPEEWLAERLASDRPLLYASDVAFSHSDVARIFGLLQDDVRGLRYVRTPTTGRTKVQLISPDSWFEYVKTTEQPLTPADIARQFGVSAEDVTEWRVRHEGCLRCDVHDHPDDTLYYTCMIFVLMRYLPPESSAVKWYRSRVSGPPLVSVAEAAEILGTTPQEVLDELSADMLRGIRTPDDTWFLSLKVVTQRRADRNRGRKG